LKLHRLEEIVHEIKEEKI